MKRLLLVLALAGPVQQLDDAVRDWTQAHRTPALNRTARTLTDIGKPLIVAGALVAVAVLDRAAGIQTARTALLALIPVNLAVEGLKRLTYRVRPDGQHKRSNAAFPSSHAANAFALATVLSWRWRRAAPFLFVFAALVAASRVYLNRHWFSDSVFGAALGTALTWWVISRWGRKPGQRPVPVRAGTDASGQEVQDL